MRAKPWGVLALAMIVSCVSLHGSEHRSNATPKKRVLFAVWMSLGGGGQPSSLIIDPVVILDNGKLEKLPDLNSQTRRSETNSEDFEKTYFQPGQKYSLFFGGAELGSVTVERVIGLSCASETATVKTSIPVPNGQDALATSGTTGLRLHPNMRRVASAQQRAAFVEVAGRFLARKGIAAISPRALSVENLRVTALGAQRPDAMIGSVTYKGKTANHNLFLVIESSGADWRTIIASYHENKDVEDGVDKVQENFVDQLDLDADGTDEIVTMSGYYESWDYAIYKEEGGTWKKVYTGGGGGC
ncbi:MAG TPA: hypothetical protein VOA78_03565 [Candidatus Dormibacteraeota bacterium]|nr:hypothetical protein [Candidatus Dormibacteraeota bacterium]